MINEKDITIYCTYHDSSFIEQYNLNYIPSYIKLFNSSDLIMPGESINYLNEYFNECVTLYYIWKNNIYSPYVGFCHYKRFFKSLGLHNLEKYGVHYFGSIQNNIKELHKNDLYTIYIDKLYEYLKTNNIFESSKLNKYFINNETINIPWKLSYIFKWENFVKISEIWWGYINYIFNDINNVNKYYRFAWVLELIFGLIVSLYFDNIFLIDTNYNTISKPPFDIIYTESNNKNDILTWIKKNNKTGVDLYINSNIYKDEDFLLEGVFITEDKSIFNNHNVLKIDINEYVRCKDPISFIENKYSINKIEQKINKSFTSWKSYFLDEQKINYNIKDTNIFKLFNTNDLNMKGDNQINYLNKYLGELVMMYYIWKNNLKSDYICISQYRKDFSYINFDKLEDNQIQIYGILNVNDKYNPVDAAFNKTEDPEFILKKKFIEYLDIQNVYDKNVVNKLKYEYVTTPRMFALVFAMKWEIYCQICEFIFGYLDYILPNKEWQNIDSLIKLREDQYKLYLNYYKDNNEWNILKEPRYLIWIIENIFNSCLSSLYNIFYNNIYIKYNIICKTNNIDLITKCYFLNKKICTEYIYILVDDNYYDEVCNSLYNQPWRSYVFPNLKVLNNAEYKTLDCENLIELNENEYIDIDDTYSIYKMTKEEIKNYIKVND